MRRARLLPSTAAPGFALGAGPALAAALVLGDPFPACSQQQADPPGGAGDDGAREVVPVATLSAWAAQVWVSLLDRDGSRSGRLSDEGVFQRFGPRMDHEYELDVRTGLFDADEDARWHRGGSGLRVAGASVSHPHVLNVVDWRQDIPVAGSVDVLARYRRERSLTARRDYPRVGARWRDALGSPWTARLDLGVHFFKPSADLELALARSWPAGETGSDDGVDPTEAGPGSPRWRLEVGIAALDAFSNTIFNTLGVDEAEVEAHLDYRTRPWATRLMLRRASPSWIFELHAGGTNRSEVGVSFPATGRVDFSQTERVTFAGLLVGADPVDRLSLAAYATFARADTERRFAPSDPAGFVLRERTTRLGMRQRLTLSRDLTLEADLERVWRPERRTPDRGATLDHRDRAVFGRLALTRRPAVGWTGRLAWAFLDRRAGRLAPRLTAANHRLVTAGGHRFASGFELVAGLRWDLDELHRHSFDGGHLRFTAFW